MTENLPEGGAEQASEGMPIPKLETVSPGSATSSVDTKALAREVADLLRPDFEKVAQSTKDKRIAEIEKKLKLSDLSELEGMGAQIPDNVKLEYRFRELEKAHNPAGSNQATTSQGSGASLTAQDVSDTVKKFQLDANDAEVIEKLRGTYRNRDHFEVTMAQMALDKATKQPGSAAAASAIVGASSTPTSAAHLESNYRKDMLDARGKGNNYGNAIKEKYRNQGVDVDNISFSV